MAVPGSPQQQGERPAAAARQPRGPPLTLARAPLQTLYWFSLSVAYGLRDAAHFVATHPVTLFLALPLLAYYGAAKMVGYNPGSTELMEVRLTGGGVVVCVGCRVG